MMCNFNTVYIDGLPGTGAKNAFRVFSKYLQKRDVRWSGNALMEDLDRNWSESLLNTEYVARGVGRLLSAPKNSSIILGSVYRVLWKMLLHRNDRTSSFLSLLYGYLDPDKNSVTIVFCPDSGTLDRDYKYAVSEGYNITYKEYVFLSRNVLRSISAFSDKFNTRLLYSSTPKRLLELRKILLPKGEGFTANTPLDYRKLRF